MSDEATRSQREAELSAAAEQMITVRLSEWLRMDGEIKRLRADLAALLKVPRRSAEALALLLKEPRRSADDD